MFESRGLLQVERSTVGEERLLEAALDAGADDVHTDSAEVYEVVTSLAAFERVKRALEAAGIHPAHAELAKVPQNTVAVPEDEAAQVLRLIDALEDHDDVQKVFANFQIADEVLARLAH
jgi:transcriptional/translational regulatory protein YebC/TACO1